MILNRLGSSHESILKLCCNPGTLNLLVLRSYVIDKINKIKKQQINSRIKQPGSEIIRPNNPIIGGHKCFRGDLANNWPQIRVMRSVRFSLIRGHLGTRKRCRGERI